MFPCKPADDYVKSFAMLTSSLPRLSGMNGTGQNIYRHPAFWLSLGLVAVGVSLPEVLASSIRRVFKPEAYEVLQEVEKGYTPPLDLADAIHPGLLPTPTPQNQDKQATGPRLSLAMPPGDRVERIHSTVRTDWDACRCERDSV